MLRGRWARALWATTAVAIAGCGDDTTGAGGSGGGGGAAPTTASVSVTSTTATATTTTTTTTSTGEGGGGGTPQGSGGEGGGQGGAGGEGGGSSACTPISLSAPTGAPSAGFDLQVSIDRSLGDRDLPDHLVLNYVNEAGSFDLAAGGNGDLATCEQCVLALEDDVGGLGQSARVYFQSAGTIDVADDGFPLATLTLTGVELIEVLVDEDGTASPVEGGACLTVVDAAVTLAPPDTWRCSPTWFGTVDGCDCACGGIDPDCDEEPETIYGCGPAHVPGQGLACEPDGTCETPPEWTCDPDLFGNAIACDCGCGTVDPDCLPLGAPQGEPPPPLLPVMGCEVDEICAGYLECRFVPPGWTCSPNYYGAADGCDCACGAYDPDCDDVEQRVLGCAPGDGCTAAGTCGVASTWTCGDATWNDGATCDCDCGAADPDCAAEPALPIPGCDASEVCVADTCVLAATNDTCAGAIPLEEGTVDGTWVGAAGDYDPLSGGCTGFSASGADVVYSVSLADGETLTVFLPGTQADSALYLVTSCDDVATSCVAGVDATGGTGDETLVYTATGAEDLLLIVDQFGTSDFIPFTLDVAITP